MDKIQTPTLLKIQKVVGIIKVVVNVLFILSFIGAFFTLIALVSLLILGSGRFVDSYQYFGHSEYTVALSSLLESSATTIFGGIVFLLARVMLSEELEDGTPFSERFALKCKKLGIFIIVGSIIVTVIVAIVVAIINMVYKVELAVDLSKLPSIVTGICFILFSYLIKYGAEIVETKTNAPSGHNDYYGGDKEYRSRDRYYDNSDDFESSKNDKPKDDMF